MASAAFSIRRYAESMRVEGAAEGHRPFYIQDLPPIKAPRFSWWADELASAVAAAGAAKTPKKRAISELFAPAPPLDVPPGGDSGCNEQTEVDGDEALCAIVRQAKEEKWKRRRQAQEDEEAAVTAEPENTGGGEPEGNFPATKDALESPNLPDGLDNRSQKPEISQHHRKESGNISGEINNATKADTQKCVANNKKCILTYTRRTSVKMAKEKHGSSKDKEVVELCHKSVNHVNFSEADGVLGSKMQSCELPEQQSLCKLLSDAMTSSSSSSSTSMEEDKRVTVESSTSHMPKEPFTKPNEANKHYHHDDNAELSNREMSAPFDLNMAPPECTYLDCTYDSNLVVPNLENTHDDPSNSDAELLVRPPLSLRELGETNTSKRQIVRLMGKDLEVCITRGESFAEAAQQHTVKSTGTIQASIYHASTSQAHFENMTQHDSSNPFPGANVSVSYTLSHPGRVVQEVSNSTGNVALLSRIPENGTGRAVPGNSYGGRAVQERSGLVKLTPGAKHILVPSDSTHGNPVPVHTCLPFGSSAAGSQNKGA